MTGRISFRPTPPTATPTTSTPIQRGAPVNVPPAPPPPPPVRSPQAFQRSAATSEARPLDLQAEAASINTAITQANPEQIQANAARLNQLGLVPQGMPAITPEALQIARQNLKPVSQHQVLNLHDAHESDASRSTVVESGRSVKLKQGGSPFGVGIVLKPGATVEVLGHGSPDGRTIGGKTPQQLAKQLKAGGATQLAVLDLKSCHSEAFKAELQQCLASEGIQVGEIKTYRGKLAIERATGLAFDEYRVGDLDQIIGHDGSLIGKEELLARISSEEQIGHSNIVAYKTRNGEAPTKAPIVNAVADSMNKALAELESGEIWENLACDAKHELVSDSNIKTTGHLIQVLSTVDEGGVSLNKANALMGYIIEDRVTQLLLLNGMDRACFQKEVHGTRPDIWVENTLIDITAEDSKGHILAKKGQDTVWFAEGANTFELTYPSVRPDQAQTFLIPKPGKKPELSAVVALKKQLDQAKIDFINNDIKTPLRNLRDSSILSITGGVKRPLTQKEWNNACESMATKIGVNSIDVKHVLKQQGLNLYPNLIGGVNEVNALKAIYHLPDIDAQKIQLFVYPSKAELHEAFSVES